ncbi:MAG: hypothetical protein V3W34_05770 [Phycisphaerae bacterium]
MKHHGEDASIEVAARADAMLEKGDLDGRAVSKRVLRAVGSCSELSLWRGCIERHPRDGAFFLASTLEGPVEVAG